MLFSSLSPFDINLVVATALLLSSNISLSLIHYLTSHIDSVIRAHLDRVPRAVRHYLDREVRGIALSRSQLQGFAVAVASKPASNPPRSTNIPRTSFVHRSIRQSPSLLHHHHFDIEFDIVSKTLSGRCKSIPENNLKTTITIKNKMRVQTIAAVLASFAITAVVEAQQTITLPYVVSRLATRAQCRS